MNNKQNYFVTEDPKRLRDSLIWDLQKQFYIEKGPTCWTEGIVPNFITSNSFIAKQYATIILGYIRDYYLKPNSNKQEPMYILEIGSGHGKLGFLIIKHLLSLKSFWPKHVEKPFVYVISDFTDKLVNFCHNHKSLKEFIDQGILDFALFDAEVDNSIHLMEHNLVLDSTTIRTPFICISNYVYNGLVEDLYTINDGVIQEGYSVVETDRQETNKHDPNIINRMRVNYIYKDINSEVIVFFYISTHKNLSLLFPYGALSNISNLFKISHGDFIILCADKAYSQESDLLAIKGNPHLASHGSFSFMTNFHALSKYIEVRGGQSIFTPYIYICYLYIYMLFIYIENFIIYISGLKVGVFIAGREKKQLKETYMNIHDTLLSFDPDSFSHIQRCIREEIPSPSLKNILSLIRLSCYENEVFYKFKQLLIDRVPYASEKIQNDIKIDLIYICNLYYPLQTTKDVHFDLGRLYMGLKCYSEGLNMFQQSVNTCGEHHVTWYNMGICYYYLHIYDKSLECFSKCLNLSPDYHDANSWKTRIEARLLNPSSPSSPRDAYTSPINVYPEDTNMNNDNSTAPVINTNNTVHVISPGEDDVE
ncbi:hypothetical protein WA158_006639 [Blastocystis sp. Blastoise]